MEILAAIQHLVWLQVQVQEPAVVGDLELALEEQVEMQAELVVAQAALLEKVEVAGAGLE